jgi:GH25 family lysozyme M1 (1,4-beta-N-acetylmuramidase)
MKRQNVRRPQPRRSVQSSFNRILKYFSFCSAFDQYCFAYHYRNGSYYFSFKSNVNEAAKQNISDVRNFQVLENKGSKVVGIDVSEYQGETEWTLRFD